jgi:hypothetical protein
MGTLIPQTKYDVLAPGTYRVRLGAVAVEDGIYGTQVVMRFDVLDEGFAGLSVKAWAAAKLSGGRRPSKLYTWTSALLFAGKPLPEGYDLDTDALRNREAWAVVEVIDRDGVLYNRVVQLFPLRAAAPQAAEPAPAPAEKSAPNGGECPNDTTSNGVFDEEPPW